MRAPRLPPTTSRRSAPARPAKRCAGSASASIVARTGLPVTTAFPPALRAESPSKPNAMRRAISASARLLSRSVASALTRRSGFLVSHATQPPGRQT